MLRKLILATALLAAPAMAADGPYLKTDTLYDGTLTAAALNGSARTSTVKLYGRYTSVIWTVSYTYSAATTVTATCTKTIAGVSSVLATSISISSGVGNIYAYVPTWTTNAANAVFPVEIGVKGADSASCVFGGASAGSSDLVSTKAVGVVAP